MNNAGGWVKFHRAVVNKGWLRNHKVWVFWSYCLLKASHEEITVLVGNQKVTLAPGEFVFGRSKAALDLGMSEQNIRSALGTLKTLKNLTIRSTNKFSVITVVNWDFYQGDTNESTSNLTDDQPASNHKQEVKKLKNKYFSSDSMEYHLAALLFNCIVKRDHDFKANLHSWAAHTDKLLRVDKRQPVDVANVILWSQKDVFWKNNVLSTAELRENFPRLFLKMNADNGRATKRELVL